LAQVFGFTKQSGGGVRIETCVGQGTSVTVFFPRAEMPAADEQAQAGAGGQASQTQENACILVVDDDGIVLKSTLRVLNSLGYAALPARSGEEALRLIADKPEIDLVLSDFAMPETNGAELARAIHVKRPTLPVIIVTGHGDVDMLKELGEARILHKPYTEGDLLNKITAALSLKK
jgi:CheY-like chemotaxis protein